MNGMAIGRNALNKHNVHILINKNKKSLTKHHINSFFRDYFIPSTRGASHNHCSTPTERHHTGMPRDYKMIARVNCSPSRCQRATNQKQTWEIVYNLRRQYQKKRRPFSFSRKTVANFRILFRGAFQAALRAFSLLFSGQIFLLRESR